MVSRGKARPGEAGFGKAGKARHGTAGRGMAWFGRAGKETAGEGTTPPRRESQRAKVILSTPLRIPGGVLQG